MYHSVQLCIIYVLYVFLPGYLRIRLGNEGETTCGCLSGYL